MPLLAAVHMQWAKSGSGINRWHQPIAHLRDVAACAEAILEREPLSTLALDAADLGRDEGQTLAQVCAL